LNDGGLSAPNAYDRGVRLAGTHINFLDGGSGQELGGGSVINNPHGTGGTVDVNGTSMTWAMTGTNCYPQHSGTAQGNGGGANTIQLDTGASGTHDAYIGYVLGVGTFIVVKITAGTGAGQFNTCVSYNGTTKVLTCADNWVVPPDNTSQFIISYQLGAGDAKWDQANQSWWSGYSVEQNGMLVDIMPGSGVLPCVVDGVTNYVASIDGPFQITLLNSAGVDTNILWSSPQTKPNHTWEDNQRWHDPDNQSSAMGSDGLARWTWADSYHSTGLYIRGENKEGFVAYFSGQRGKTWYSNSTMHNEGLVMEQHIYDPAHLGECALGTREPWDVKPTHITAPSELDDDAQDAWETAFNDPGSPVELSGASHWGRYHSAWFDETTNKLYVFGALIPNQFTFRIRVYDVDC
jgi:hypothetical protein